MGNGGLDHSITMKLSRIKFVLSSRTQVFTKASLGMALLTVKDRCSIQMVSDIEVNSLKVCVRAKVLISCPLARHILADFSTIGGTVKACAGVLTVQFTVVSMRLVTVQEPASSSMLVVNVTRANSRTTCGTGAAHTGTWMVVNMPVSGVTTSVRVWV